MGRAPWAGTIEGRDDWHAVARCAGCAPDVAISPPAATPRSPAERRPRVSLARVLAQHTPIVFLDEPTASLDLRHQEDVMRLGRRMADDGRAVVVVVHDLSLAAAYADRLAIIAAGRLEAVGTPREVLTRSASSGLRPRRSSCTW